MLDLRPVRPGDAGALHALLADADVARWLRPKHLSGPYSLRECEAIAARDAAHWGAHGFGPWLAWDGDICAGRCLLEHSVVEGRGEVEIGWAVTSRCWGRGVGTAMGRHALAAGAERGIANLVAFTRVDNVASRRVMEKLGLAYERGFHHAGYPHVLYRTIQELNSP
ncbi:MAG TPA: GNAT family N-acetyltransferase [Solirubrobacteraceae bacterium]|jgi:ribosomal-protein-alanine N-acetyltransferase|nr:GNAT family N-acetyltransferase [Solirubrobacteraceae bacterium]